MEEEIKLSAKAKQQIAGLEATNERMRLETIQMEAKLKALEEIARRKQDFIRRQEEFLAAIDAERQAVDAEYQCVCERSPA